MASLLRSARFAPEAVSVGLARHLVVKTLREEAAGRPAGRPGGHGLDEDTVDTAALLASELVTNAVLHAETDIVVTIRIGPGILVQVEDASPELPQPREHAADSAGGRGLDLVEALATRFGTDRHGDGRKSVWFTLGPAPVPGPSGWRLGPPQLHRIGVLLNLPVGLYRVLQEYTEALLRDFELSRLQDRDAGGDRAPEAGGRGGAAVRAAVRTRARFAERTLQALSGLPDSAHHDTPVLAEEADAQGFRDLLQTLEAAEAARRAGASLTRPAVPELLTLRGWVLGEITRQLAGEPPTPWALQAVRPRLPSPRLPAGPLRWVDTSLEAVVAADDANRIVAVSPPAARLLGWDPRDLAGQRLTVIIPEEWREAHLAGYSRHQLTGRANVIGETVRLPALRRDGTTVPVRLRLTARAVGSGTWYLAWIETDPPVPG